MQPTVLFAFLSLAVVIGFFSFLTVAIWTHNRRVEREGYYQSENLKKIADAQGSSASAALEFLRDQEKIRALRSREGIKLGGLVAVAVGLGMLPLLRAIATDKTGDHSVYLLGLIPLLVGLALLAYVYLLTPKD